MITSGFFITVHGIDGSGKTTLCTLLHKYFSEKNISNVLYEDIKKEWNNPFDTSMQREILQNLSSHDEIVKWWDKNYTWQKEKIVSYLQDGFVFIRDRWIIDVLTNHEYNSGISFESLQKIYFQDCILPNISIFLEVSQSIREGRIKNRNEGTATLDDFDSEKLEKKQIIMKRFFAQKSNVIHINTDFYTSEEVLSLVLQHSLFVDYVGKK